MSLIVPLLMWIDTRSKASQFLVFPKVFSRGVGFSLEFLVDFVVLKSTAEVHNSEAANSNRPGPLGIPASDLSRPSS